MVCYRAHIQTTTLCVNVRIDIWSLSSELHIEFRRSVTLQFHIKIRREKDRIPRPNALRQCVVTGSLIRV